MSRPVALFAGIVLACVLLGAGSIVLATQGGGSDAAPAGAAGVRVAAPAAAPGKPTEVLFRRMTPEQPRLENRVGVVGPSGAGRVRTTALRCLRVHYAAGRGICVTPSKTGATFEAAIFDDRFRVLGTIGLEGAPSRARVSPDGRYGTVTTFVGGHSYAEPGQFSTATVLIDMEKRKPIANLEKFAVTRDGKAIDAPDVNYWGVTFTPDSNRFYATLGTGSKTYLIEGDVRARTARTVRENVECPSVSPDGTRIAYKKLVGAPAGWRLHVLDLRTMRDTPVADERPIDDQVEWLDDRRLLYGASQQVWEAPADGSGAPRRFLTAAESPAVVRGRAGGTGRE